MHIAEPLKEKMRQYLQQQDHGMSEALGITLQSVEADRIEAHMPVHSPTRQPFGILHGGASVALAETLASIGGWLNVDVDRFSVAGMEINANHLRSLSEGSVCGVARPLHLGSRTQVWEIRITGPQDKLICVSRCTLAVIDRT